MWLRKFSVVFLLFFFVSISVMPAAASDKAVHVLVALCDNIHQGIVPVSKTLGNGDIPKDNLYWGAAYGVKTFMLKQKGWKQEEAGPGPLSYILERIILRNEALDVTLVADAYKGSAIKETTVDFLDYCAGMRKSSISYGKKKARIGGDADLVVYVGHNGLMDFSLDSLPLRTDDRKRKAAVFACQSKAYFAEALNKAGVEPLLWTCGNMAPEAYAINALINSWALNKKEEAIRREVATAYNQFQKCGMRGALRLFSTGY